VSTEDVLTGFLAAYTVMYVGSGFLVDRFGTRWSLSVFIVWWSLANMAHAFARGPWSLGILRFLLGMGESGNFMAAFKVVSEWYPAKERALVHGVIQGGAAIGAIIAPPAITWINVHYGWQPAFVVTGSLGFVWLALWLILYHPPEAHPRITQEEREYVLAEGTQSPDLPKASWKEILRFPQNVGSFTGAFYFGSSVVVLPLLAAEIFGGTTRIYDGRNGNARVDAGISPPISGRSSVDG